MEQLATFGEAMLRLEGVEASTSRLSHLHAELGGARAIAQRARGEHERAAWTAFDADRVAMRSTEEEAESRRILLMAQQALRLGQGRLALELFQVASVQAPPDVRAEAHIGLIDGLMLSGDRANAVATAKEAQSQLDLSDAARTAFSWRLGRMDAERTGDFNQLFHMTARGGPFFEAAYLVDLGLLVNAVRTRAHLGRCLKPKTLKRAFPEDTAAARGELHFALQVLDAIANAYDATLPLEARLGPLETAFHQRSKLATLDRELLVLAALARCLSRLRQDAFAALVMGIYRNLSLGISDGHQPDGLGLVAVLRAGLRHGPDFRRALLGSRHHHRIRRRRLLP